MIDDLAGRAGIRESAIPRGINDPGWDGLYYNLIEANGVNDGTAYYKKFKQLVSGNKTTKKIRKMPKTGVYGKRKMQRNKTKKLLYKEAAKSRGISMPMKQAWRHGKRGSLYNAIGFAFLAGKKFGFASKKR